MANMTGVELPCETPRSGEENAANASSSVVESSLKRRAMRASAITLAGFGGTLILRFGSNWLLWRLLFPSAFGVMTLLNSFLQGLQMFTDQGIGTSIIRHERGDDPRFVNTAWSIQVVRGGLLYLTALVIAWPLSQLYETPELLWYFPVSATSLILLGLTSTAQFTLDRRLALGRVMVLDLSAQAAAAIVMVVWAWFWPSVWALVGGTLVGAMVRTIGSHRINPGAANRWEWEPAAVASLRSFGKWIMLSSGLTFLGTQADRLLMGWYLSLEALGVYGQAAVFATTLNDMLQQLASKVVMPSISRLASLPRAELQERLLRHRRPFLFGAAALLTLSVASVDLFIRFAYDERCRAAGWMASALMLGAWWRVLAMTLAPALLAIDRPKYQAAAMFARMFAACVGIPIAYWAWGMPGVVIAVTASGVPQYLVLEYGLQQHGLSGWRQDFWATLALGAMLAGAYGIRAACGLPFEILTDISPPTG